MEKIRNILNVHLNNIFNFEYTQKSRASAPEKESAKLLAYHKTKRADDIKMCYRILRTLFEQIEKTYQPKKI